jgi:hypothetical protein
MLVWAPSPNDTFIDDYYLVNHTGWLRIGEFGRDDLRAVVRSLRRVVAAADSIKRTGVRGA